MGTIGSDNNSDREQQDKPAPVILLPAWASKPLDNNPKPEKYAEEDLDEFCLWLYGIYEETTIRST